MATRRMMNTCVTAHDSRARWSLRRIIVCLTIATIALLIAIPIFKVRAERRVRSRVDALLNSTNWDWTLPTVANWSNRQEQLQANAAVILKVLREDLTFDPSQQPRWSTFLKTLTRVGPSAGGRDQ